MTLREKLFKQDYRDQLHQGAMQEDLYGAFFVPLTRHTLR